MTQLRFDIVNTQGSVDLDYVRFTDSEANILIDSGENAKAYRIRRCDLYCQRGRQHWRRQARFS